VRRRFIYYSLAAAFLAGAGALLRPEEAFHFLEDWLLWYEPVTAGLICGLLGALLGVYVLLNRIVFISLAISQGAGLGIFLSYWIAGLWGLQLGDSPLALTAGLTAAVLTALLFSLGRKSRVLTDESLIGLLYAGSSGLIIFVGDRISEGKHDIDNLLFGNAVAVTGDQLAVLSAATAAIFVVHFVFRRELLYTSADPTFLATRGVGIGAWRTLLFATLTVGITVAMRTIGSLPVFALMVIPPWIALRRARSLKETFGIALLIGAFVPPLGYYVSFLYSFPTGASLIVVGIIFVAAGFLDGVFLRRRRS
jgi:zinc transport system permease protein